MVRVALMERFWSTEPVEEILFALYSSDTTSTALPNQQLERDYRRRSAVHHSKTPFRTVGDADDFLYPAPPPPEIWLREKTPKITPKNTLILESSAENRWSPRVATRSITFIRPNHGKPTTLLCFFVFLWTIYWMNSLGFDCGELIRCCS